MRTISVSLVLTVFYDVQFWVGIVELVLDGHLRVCRSVFGSEPSDEELFQWILKKGNKLVFGQGVAADYAKQAKNPKRRQREAQKALRSSSVGTKAQLALSEQRDHLKQVSSLKRLAMRAAQKEERYQLRSQKRKKKKRGH